MAALALHTSDLFTAVTAGPVVTTAQPQPPARDFHTGSSHLWLAHSEARPVERQGGSQPIHSVHDLVVQLCGMPVDLAAPLLRSSLPSLDGTALLALIAATGEAHHRLIAGRPDLDDTVIRALIRSNSDAVLLTLAENRSLTFSAETQAILVRLASDRKALRAAILANPSLPQAGERLRLESGDGLNHQNLRLVKLLRAGLPAKFLVEAARRLDCEATGLQHVLADVSAVPFALLCRALGLDRAVFLDLLPRWQTSHAGEAECNAAHRPLVLSVFALAPAEAGRKLMAIAEAR